MSALKVDSWESVAVCAGVGKGLQYVQVWGKVCNIGNCWETVALCTGVGKGLHYVQVWRNGCSIDRCGKRAVLATLSPNIE